MSAARSNWLILKHYDQDHLARIAMPLGGIGTGTVSLGGRGDLRDWEIMNRPAKGFVPGAQGHDAHGGRPNPPFFALWVQDDAGKRYARALEGPLELVEYEGDWGSTAPNHGLPRFRECSFDVAYPLAQVRLSDEALPVDVTLEAFNPLIPGDADASGLPVAVLRYVIHNTTDGPLTVAVCGSLPNFIGMDGGVRGLRDDRGSYPLTGAKANRNAYRGQDGVQGVFMASEGVEALAPQWGTLALCTAAQEGVTYRTAWADLSWGDSLLDFWDDFSADGALDERESGGADTPVASLAVKTRCLRRCCTRDFCLAWHFPNR